ncbi:MAG: hypothetical protein ACXAD7_23460 [Candidatus Kariarchaeaceae archaeon]
MKKSGLISHSSIYFLLTIIFFTVFVVSILNELIIPIFISLIVFPSLFFIGFVLSIIPHIARLSDEYEEELKPLIGLNSDLPTDNGSG